MAESQLQCMEDGLIGSAVPESSPGFYYSEQQRAALEVLLRDGDAQFKERLAEDEYRDFLSAREIKEVQNTFKKYETEEDSAAERAARRTEDSDSVRSTYWPQLSEREIPQLDLGWPTGGFLRAITRVMVYTHPAKINMPHIKEVVRKLIQEARKVIAIVMDLLTDIQILQDLLDASFQRKIAVYIILDLQGSPHFLDMCNRLQVKAHHLQNIRTRTVRGVGFDLSFGRIPGSLCSKYMIIDGDKVMFGSYSFSWSSSRMDRQLITVISGQIVDDFDLNFREIYAISEELNLYKEFSISKTGTQAPSRINVPTMPSRLTMPATSRFQVSLGDAGTLKVPAHKYHNPKYLLALGAIPDNPTTTIQEMVDKMQLENSTQNPPVEDEPMLENCPQPNPLPTENVANNKKSKKSKLFSRKSKNKASEVVKEVEETPVLAADGVEGVTEKPTSSKRKSKGGKKTTTSNADDNPKDADSKDGKYSKKSCVLS